MALRQVKSQGVLSAPGLLEAFLPAKAAEEVRAAVAEIMAA
jgi:hypothetical protein